MKDFMKGAKTIEQMHKEWLKRPGYKKALDDLELEYEIIDLVVKERAKTGNYNSSIRCLRKIIKDLTNS
jgi:hypothetical protein